MKKIISALIALIMVCGLSVPAFAVNNGDGTEENPYLIYTAQDLVEIADDLSAHYKLANNIDMSSIASFYPIGNSNDGAFTGSIDGNGKTVSNLKIDTPNEKYTGFVGYNEGKIKNLNLVNADVYGGRYTGGLIGYNSTDSTVSNCTVSGSVKSDKPSAISMNVGGVIGYNGGTVSGLSNSADVDVSPADKLYCDIYVGGIIGCNDSIVDIDGFENSGKVNITTTSEAYTDYDSNYNLIQNSKLYRCVGGIVGKNNREINILNCDNKSLITANCKTSIPCCGGIIGLSMEKTNINNCINSGNVFSYANIWRTYRYQYTAELYSGGIAGYLDKDSIVFNCHNSGEITSKSQDSYIYYSWSSYYYLYQAYSGGIVGYINGEVKNCENKGVILSSFSAGGIIGKGDGVFEDLINVGDIKYFWNGRGSYSLIAYLGGIAGEGKGTFSNVYNSGDIIVDNYYTYPANSGICGACFGETYFSQAVSVGVSNNNSVTGVLGANVYVNECAMLYGIVFQASTYDYYHNGRYARDYQIHISNSMGYGDLFKEYYPVNINNLIRYQKTATQETLDENWGTNHLISNGQPHLIMMEQYPIMNRIVEDLKINETVHLEAYQNGMRLNNLIWKSYDETIAIVNSNGIVTAVGSGTTFVTAKTDNGFKAVCRINVYSDPVTENELNEENIIINKNMYSPEYSFSNISDEEIVFCKIENENVIQKQGHISSDYLGVKFRGKNEGTTKAVLFSSLGNQKTINITVTNFANSISLPTTATVNRGKTYQLPLTKDPIDNHSQVTWVSSDESIAQVNQEGVVTGTGIGNVVITAITDNGCIASCTVTVNAPVEIMAMEKVQVVIPVGSTGYVKAVPDPIDTTDKVTYSSSNTGIATVDASTGMVTARSVGSVTITARADSGAVAYGVVVVTEVQPSNISLNNTSLNLLTGDTQQLSYNILPGNVTNKNVKWSVGDTSIAVVSNNGLVTAVSPGTTKVTVTTSDGRCSATCNIYVGDVGSAENSGITVNHSEKLIYGFDITNRVEDSLTSLGEGFYLKFSDNATPYTGNHVQIMKNGKAFGEYTIVLFGDVNGDGWYDGMDSMIVSCLSNGMLDSDDLSEAEYMAADCNHDGKIDSLDVEILREAGILLADIDQLKSPSELLETSSAYVEYLNLIDQTVEEETTEVVKDEPVDLGYTFNFFDMILNLIKEIIVIIKSALAVIW